MTNLKKKAAKGVFWSGLASILTGILQAILLIVFARNVQPSDYGLISLTMVIIGFILLYSDVGLSGIIVQSQNLTRNQLSTFFYFNCFSGIALFLLTELLTPLLVGFFNNKDITPALRICSVILLTTFTGRISESMLQKKMHFKALAIIDIVSTSVSFATASILIFKNYGMWAIAGSQITNSAVRTILLLIFGFRVFKPAFHFSLNDLSARYVHFGLYQSGERTVNYFLERFDQFLIGKFGTASLLGSYSFAFNTVIQSLNRINPPLIKVAFPVFTRLQNDIEQLRKNYLLTIRIISIINTSILAGFIAVSYTAIPLLFSNKWNESIPIFQVLSMVVLLRCIGNPSGALALAKAKANIGFYWNLAFLIISIPALTIGFIWGKALGVAIALLILQIILMYPFYRYCIKSIIGSCFRDYTKAAFMPMLAGGISVLLTYKIFNSPGMMQLVLKLLIFESIFFVLLMILCRRDWLFIKRMTFHYINKFLIKSGSSAIHESTQIETIQNDIIENTKSKINSNFLSN